MEFTLGFITCILSLVGFIFYGQISGVIAVGMYV